MSDALDYFDIIGLFNPPITEYEIEIIEFEEDGKTVFEYRVKKDENDDGKTNQ